METPRLENSVLKRQLLQNGNRFVVVVALEDEDFLFPFNCSKIKILVDVFFCSFGGKIGYF